MKDRIAIVNKNPAVKHELIGQYGIHQVNRQLEHESAHIEEEIKAIERARASASESASPACHLVRPHFLPERRD